MPEWDANTEIDLQSVLVEEVREGTVAHHKGIRKGDEVALINDKSVMELGWVEVERLLSGLKSEQFCPMCGLMLLLPRSRGHRDTADVHCRRSLVPLHHQRHHGRPHLSSPSYLPCRDLERNVQEPCHTHSKW